VTNVDLLIEPHHGRKSGRSYDFLDTLKPKVTIFGNANSEHLAYGALTDFQEQHPYGSGGWAQWNPPRSATDREC
jgi:hypothetical protein